MKSERILVGILALVVLGLGALATAMVASANPIEQQNPQVVEIDLMEWSINPQTITVTAGVPVRFVLRNTGQFPHNLEVGGNGIHVKSENIPAGGRGELTYTFQQAGGYAIWCSFGMGRHLERGMWGTLRVTNAQGQVPFTPPAAAPQPGASPAPANAQMVTVDMEEWMFRPQVITVTAGVPVRFTLRNTGRFPHYMEIAGYGIDVHSGNVVSGTTGVFDYTFQQPGGYAAWCPVGGGTHLMRGMISTVYVVPAGGQAAAPAAPAPPAAPPAAAGPAQPAMPGMAMQPGQPRPPTAQMPANMPRSGEAPTTLLLLGSLGLLSLLAGLSLARRRDP